MLACRCYYTAVCGKGIQKYRLMNVLAIDTSTTTLGLCLHTDATLLEAKIRIGLRHSELLLPWIKNFYAEARIHQEETNLVVCALGPGSFTGLRIGISTAKGISFGAPCPIVGVPTLDSLAARFSIYPGIVVPAYTAKKGHYYTALFYKGRRITDYLDTDVQSLGSVLKNVVLENSSHPQNQKQECPDILITGSEAHTVSQSIRKLHGFCCDVDTGSSCSDPYILMKTGIDLFRKNGDATDNLLPIYVRKSDAEITMLAER